MRSHHAIVVVAALVGCSTTAPNLSSEEAAIRSARLEQNLAISNGDKDAIASYWTDDVTVRSGLGIPVAGRAAYRERITANGLVYVRTPTTIEVSGHWPLAFESGNWTAHRGSISGEEITSGRYSAQWIKREGHWLIRAEVFVALRCRGSGCDAAIAP
jgi:ketosteroid isomerase-like protein